MFPAVPTAGKAFSLNQVASVYCPVVSGSVGRDIVTPPRQFQHTTYTPEVSEAVLDVPPHGAGVAVAYHILVVSVSRLVVLSRAADRRRARLVRVAMGDRDGAEMGGALDFHVRGESAVPHVQSMISFGLSSST